MTTHPHSHTVSLTVLGSGSSGNSIAISWGESTLLVDAGFSARETIRRLEASEVDPAGVGAILLTHEHGDHVSGMRVLAKRLGVPVYATPGTRRASGLEASVADPRDLQAGHVTRIGGFEVVTFQASHDAAEPVGFRLEAPDGTVIGIMTDTGEMTPEAGEALSGCALLCIESNHDVDLLTNGPYPWFLKQRILSTRGHLSNDAAAAALAALAHDGLKRVVALHLSDTNNEASRAHQALAGALERLDHGALVTCACQATPHRV